MNMTKFFDEIGGSDRYINVDLYAQVKFCGKLPGGVSMRPEHPGIHIAPFLPRSERVDMIVGLTKHMAYDIEDLQKSFNKCMIHSVVCPKNYAQYVIDESLDNVWRGNYKFGKDIYDDLKHLICIMNGTIDFRADISGEIKHMVLIPNIHLSSPKFPYEIWIPMDFLLQAISGNPFTYSDKLVDAIKSDFAKLNDGVRIISVINFLEADFKRMSRYNNPDLEYILRPMEEDK